MRDACRGKTDSGSGHAGTELSRGAEATWLCNDIVARICLQGLTMQKSHLIVLPSRSGSLQAATHSLTEQVTRIHRLFDLQRS